MKNLNSTYIILLSFLLVLIFFINTLIFVQPEFITDSNTHRQYLFATTFGITGEYFFRFPEWVYAPWYYMFCSYIFGPIFFGLYKLNFINLEYACMYTMLFGTLILKLFTIIGSYKFASKLFFNQKEYASLFAMLVVVLPFGNKDFYGHNSETMGVMLLPFCFYFLINYLEKKKLKYLFFYVISFGLGGSLKINVLVPFILFNLLFIFFYIPGNFFNKKKFKLFMLSLLSLMFFLAIYKFFIGVWIWENSDVRNFGRNYGEPPEMSVFLSLNLSEYWKNPIIWKNSLYYGDNLTFWTQIFADFFSDGTGVASNYMGLNISESYLSFKIRSGLVFTALFIAYMTFGHLKILKKKTIRINNFLSFNFLFSISFFLFIPVAICYSFFVFHKWGGSWDLRYSSMYVFPLVYLMINFFINTSHYLFKKINFFLCFLLILFSIFQRLIILV